jgi:tetratricopeptide (TPR) repeat protein
MSDNELDVEAVFKKLKELGARDTRPKYATDFIVEFLTRTNRVATTAEIRAALRDADISIKDSSLNWTLTNLNTRGDIQRVSRGRYRIQRPEPNLLHEAEALAAQGSLDQALAAYAETIRLFPNNVVAYVGRAETLRSMGRLEEALATYEEVITRFPADVVAYNGRAEALRSLGRLEEALETYEIIIKRFPNDVIARNGRAEVLHEMVRFEVWPSARTVPPPPEAIPAPVRRALQFASAADGPIDLAALSQPGEHLVDGPNRQEDYHELRVKAVEISILGSNRLGRLHGPISRFLGLSENVDRVRAKLFWSRINTLRIILLSHEQATEAWNDEPDERRLETTPASLLKDLVETINVFVVGDPGLMELDAVRPGPKETEIAQEETIVLAPMIADLGNNPNVATELAREILSEQAENLEIADVSLPGRQAAEFGRRSIQNFVGELLRRAYAPVPGVSRRAASEAGVAWKSIREGAYRAVGAGLITGAITDLVGVTDFTGAIISFVTHHAEALIAYVTKSFQNPALVEIVNWIVRFGS